MEENLFSLQQFKISQETEKSIQHVKNRKVEMYAPDFKQFEVFCERHLLPIDFDSLELYLHESITIQQVRLSTFNRRLAGVKYWLTTKFNQQQSLEQEERVRLLRQLYNEETFLRLKPQRGVRAESQQDVLRLIDRYDTNKKADIRKRAICLVNLITANRPSEMVRLKMSDFDLENRSVWVMMKKQGEMKEKRLTLECVQSVSKYIQTCELQPEDYFVGASDKWGNHTSRQIHEDSYNQSIHAWLGFAPYTFRKTQITAMYNKGADIPTIAKQSGHKSHQTIMEHYINLKSSDVDEFL
ncbi:integrase/recombinase XerC [Psychrobacillus insolitus]|uniref:Integrase/recombinase XerC n=1 Tax=Psychrobacillus insolitus TaxID=1461 RepID=A0A2W7MCE0_9BACI|nr:site-specific integrase [Psychrobacillus insolitus]PZX02902.1 integrase/recombinase XerC [Psychrobacillus insolitus]